MSDHDDDHLANLSDGMGCAEVWEHLSARRVAESDETDPDANNADVNKADDADSESDLSELADNETTNGGSSDETGQKAATIIEIRGELRITQVATGHQFPLGDSPDMSH